MQLLLDTHAYLWWLTDDSRLSEPASKVIADPDSLVFVSPATIWEARIKQRLGRLEMGGSDLVEEIEANGFLELPISARHASDAAALPTHHTDPFDRMLVAQARFEGLTLVTKDRALASYEVMLAW